MKELDRRDVLTGLAAAGSLFIGSRANAQGAQPAKGPAVPSAAAQVAPPAAPVPAAIKLILDSTAACIDTGRLCLARCTDHLAAGMKDMADCQRAVMNMLAVVEAMGAVARYSNSDSKQIKMLAQACAAYCTACEKACAPHAKKHDECRACGEACRSCAAACNKL